MPHFFMFEFFEMGHEMGQIKFFDFGAFQKIMKMLSREKILFHMLFGASHDTPRIVFLFQDEQRSVKSFWSKKPAWWSQKQIHDPQIEITILEFTMLDSRS